MPVQVEWQKRGLPHAHILIILEERIRPDQYDDFVQAELPNAATQPLLRKLVEEHMMHGPCGPDVQRNPPCFKDGACTKRFPKPWCASSQAPRDGGYVEYMRRNDGCTVRKCNCARPCGGREGCDAVDLDNRSVVPYNAHLLQKFATHMNVEICNSIQSVKYVRICPRPLTPYVCCPPATLDPRSYLVFSRV